MGPIKTNSFKFKKSAVFRNKILIAIDIGDSLIKLIFLDKRDAKEFNDNVIDHITLQYNVFYEKDIDIALAWLKDNSYLPNDKSMTIRVTGSKYGKHRGKIQSIFHRNHVFINEMTSIVTGHRFALEQIPVDNLRYPLSETEHYGKIENDVLDKIIEGMKKKVNFNNPTGNGLVSTFPCLVCFCGSSLAYIYFDENGNGQLVGPQDIGDITFLGIAKSLLDTNNYEEIMNLSQKGNRCNVDTQVKEVLDGNIHSPYGRFPPELPILCFGKCADYDHGKDFYSKEDLASALVALFSLILSACSNGIILRKKINKIYFTGNIFRHDAFRKQLQTATSFISIGLEYIMLDMEFCTALGALISGEDQNF